jgi:hypothetical protein
MSRRPALVTQAEIARALRAAGDGRAVEILPDGTIRIVPIGAITSDRTFTPPPADTGFAPTIPLPLDDGSPVAL